MLDLDKLICEGFELKLSRPTSSVFNIPDISGYARNAAPESFSILLSGIRNHLFRYLNHLMLNQYEAVQRILQGANNLLKEEF